MANITTTSGAQPAKLTIDETATSSVELNPDRSYSIRNTGFDESNAASTGILFVTTAVGADSAVHPAVATPATGESDAALSIPPGQAEILPSGIFRINLKASDEVVVNLVPSETRSSWR